MKESLLIFILFFSFSSLLAASPLTSVGLGEKISAAKYNELVDKINLLSQSIPKITPWTSGGPVSITSTSGVAPSKGTVVEDLVEYKQVGDTFDYRYKLIQSSPGYAGTGVYIFNLPAGTSFSSAISKATPFTQTAGLSGAQYYGYTMVRNVIKADGFVSILNGHSGTIHGQVMVVPINATQFQVLVLWSSGTAFMMNSANVNMGAQYVSFNFRFSAKSDVVVNKDL